MRVRKLGVQEKLELRTQIQLFVSHLDVLALSLLDVVSSIDWLDNGINGVFKILNQHWVSDLNRLFNSSNHLWI